MKNKLWRILRLCYASIFIIALFSLIKILVLWGYHLQQSNGDYTLVMEIMDKAHEFQIGSYITGFVHCGVVCVMLKIVFEK